MDQPRPNLNLYPPRGYVLTIGGINYEGTSWVDVAEKIRAYRFANKLPIGDPEAEVNATFCAEYPHYCHQKAPAAIISGPAYAKAQSKNFTNRVLSWLADTFSRVFMNTIPVVDKAVADHRAEICSVCPHQRPKEADCITCGGNYKKLSEDIRAKIGNAAHRELLCCGILGEDTSISVGLKQKKANSKGLPDYCWRQL